jgi:predicted DNA-binding transcriptional regulator YafY
MIAFKSSVHRLYFIDKQIREGSFPTTVSLASEYEAKYGKSVDPRTIAADISALKEKFNAPLSYDYKKRGYFYTDPYFQLPVLQMDPDNPLPTMAVELRPRTAEIPLWQQTFLLSLVDKLLPLKKGTAPHKQVSVLLDSLAPSDALTEKAGKEIVRALDSYDSLDMVYADSGKRYIDLLFKPLHLICTLNRSLVFGMVNSGRESRYSLLYLDRIREAKIRHEPSEPPSYLYIISTGNQDIEVVLSRDKSDLLLVFAPNPETPTQKHPLEYSLRIQTEIFAS